MQLKSVGEVIATRTLFFASDKTRKVLVRMGKPQPLPDAVGALGSDHYCPFQITGIGDEKVRYGAGVDAFQSLELGLKMIGTSLAYLNREHNGELRWDGDESGGLGFPFPEAFRE
jgi:hypothetical protein